MSLFLHYFDGTSYVTNDKIFLLELRNFILRNTFPKEILNHKEPLSTCINFQHYATQSTKLESHVATIIQLFSTMNFISMPNTVSGICASGEQIFTFWS